jgi:cytochrome P450
MIPCFRYAYQAFGQGPRNCMGVSRFALYEAKVGIISVLHKYRFVKTHNTLEKIVYDPKAAFGQSEDPLWVKVERR